MLIADRWQQRACQSLLLIPLLSRDKWVDGALPWIVEIDAVLAGLLLQIEQRPSELMKLTRSVVTEA